MAHFRSFAILAISLASYVSHTYAHAAISPMLGVQGTPVRSDVQFPLENVAPCGKVSPSENLDTSTPVQMAADGTVTMTITNFNPTIDGSREVKTALVDTTGTGNSFSVQATMVQNGDGNPLTDGSEQIVASMPAGTQCTGGTSGNLCLMSMKTTFGFGNCVVVQQSNSSTASSATSASASDSAADTTSTDTASAAAAAATTADTSATAAQGATAEGAAAQGAAAEGATAQGATAQGATAQGATAQGATAQGATAQGATAQGATAQGGIAGAVEKAKAKAKGLRNIAGTRAARAFKDGIEGRSVRDEKRSGWFWA
ncbi:hypothetical protein GYMLUDRAFT_48668 [Collybiopsis luxurians FD-317 M1]|uniref:Uncharacterized protein n=1 Tax=Collybiopsis luxurians FD-317 M1 TaxID=944289 RepID=A0A0D0C9B4_9AGAR|nr:hypothetical protein GYMLUDRAFT_48668 [Collybiopsis luxurians FD-317 M1]